jgi:hypothetical protein
MASGLQPVIGVQSITEAGIDDKPD